MENKDEAHHTESFIEQIKREAAEKFMRDWPEHWPIWSTDFEAKLDSCSTQIKELQDKVSLLENQLKSKKTKEKREKVWYFAPLLVVIIFTGYLVYYGWAEAPSVAINYNVGEIIGGLLTGIGALMAGAAYAFRRSKGE